MHLNDLSDKKPAPNGILKNFNVGDYIQVKWLERRTDRESYKSDGVIVQITDDVIHYRCQAGYVCAVSKNQIASGIQVKVVQKAKVA